MPDLATRANDVFTRAQALRDAEKTRQAETQFAQRRSILQQLQQRLQVAQEFRSAAAGIGLMLAPDVSLLHKAGERLEAAKKAFGADRESLLNEMSFRILINSLEGAAESLE